jgi:hypothetical protein
MYSPGKTCLDKCQLPALSLLNTGSTFAVQGLVSLFFALPFDLDQTQAVSVDISMSTTSKSRGVSPAAA